MNEEKIIEEYVKKFGELPPNDAVISYYDELYQKLMEKSIETNRPITPEILEKAIGDKPYDIDTNIFDPDEEEDYEL